MVKLDNLHGDIIYIIRRDMADVAEGVDSSGIDGEDDNQLDYHREAAAHRVELFLLIEVHYLLLHLLLGDLIGSAGIAVSYRLLLRTEGCLLDHVLLLLDPEREEQYLYDQGEKQKCYCVVRNELIAQVEDITECLGYKRDFYH